MSVKEIVTILKKASKAYYNTNTSIISDKEYDDYRDRLAELDPTNKYLNTIGSPILKGKVQLPYPMGSLTKLKDVSKWTNKYTGPYIISDKLDGVSAQIHKISPTQIHMYTRGNGTDGQDITHLLKYVITQNTIALMPNNTSIRGELIMTKKNFRQIETVMKNGRNAVSGIVNTKTTSKHIKLVSFVSYNIIYPQYTQSKQLLLLQKWGLNVVTYVTTKIVTNETLSDYLKIRKRDSEYEMDGIVCVDNATSYSLIDTTWHYPEHAFAYKEQTQDQIMTATVIDVLWEPSVYGYLKPRIQINPIVLGCVTIQYATGRNALYIYENNIGPNAVIRIVRSGDVIPNVLDVVKPAKKPKMPNVSYEWTDTNVDIYLVNPSQEDQQTVTIKVITHFFKTIGVKYMSEGIISNFVKNEYDSVFKILKADKSKICLLDGLKEKTVTKIYNSIDKALKNVKLPTLMSASHTFGRGLGTRKIQEIINAYPDILESNMTKGEMYVAINNISGFSDKTTTLFVTNYNSFVDFHNKLIKIVDLPQLGSTQKKSRDFKNQTVVFTGFRDKHLEDVITSNGGKIMSAVSSNTTLLVYDGQPITNAKYKKAIELDIDTLSKSDFMKMISQYL